MGTSKKRIRIGSWGLAAATATAALGTEVAAAGPAAAAGDPIRPMSCGMVDREIGPLSSAIHQLEPALASLRLDYVLHDLNCSVVIGTEYVLGLQQRSQRPGPGLRVASALQHGRGRPRPVGWP